MFTYLENWEKIGQDHRPTLLSYVRSFAFSGQRILNCMSIFLSPFRLPAAEPEVTVVRNETFLFNGPTTSEIEMFVIGSGRLTVFTNIVNIYVQYDLIGLTNFQAGIDTIISTGNRIGSQSVWESIGQDNSPEDLTAFQENFDLHLEPVAFDLGAYNHLKNTWKVLTTAARPILDMDTPPLVNSISYAWV